MGRDLISFPFASDIFDFAQSTLGVDIKSLCLNGPDEELRKTVNTQVAVFVISFVCLELLRSVGIRHDIVAGHSLGEYSALVAAEVIGFREGLTLIAERAKLMQELADSKPGAMIAVLGLDFSEVSGAIEDLQSEGTISVANYNCPGQLVVSGEKGLVAKARFIFEQRGARRVIFLPVGGAFHTRMMERAEKELACYLERVVFEDAKVPLISNSTAQIATDAETLKVALSRQMTSPVLWQQTIEKMMETGVQAFVEVGPGKVLSGLIKRIDKAANVLNVEDEKSFEDVKAMLT